MFEFVNPIAVLGTTFFMMAVATLWYSEYLFQKVWLKAVKLTESDLAVDTNLKRNMLMTFFAYGLTILCIAIAIGYAQVFAVSVQKISLLMTVSFTLFLAALSIWERRPLSYWFVTAGFTAVFIFGSTFFLYHWPW